MTPMKATALLAGGACAGWVLENAYTSSIHGDPLRYSKMFGGARVPLLPVYGVGLLAAVSLAPVVRSLPWYAQLATFVGALSAVELGAGALDSALGGKPSWEYPDGSHVDPPHALTWGCLALAARRLA